MFQMVNVLNFASKSSQSSAQQQHSRRRCNTRGQSVWLIHRVWDINHGGSPVRADDQGLAAQAKLAGTHSAFRGRPGASKPRISPLRLLHGLSLGGPHRVFILVPVVSVCTPLARFQGGVDQLAVTPLYLSWEIFFSLFDDTLVDSVDSVSV